MNDETIFAVALEQDGLAARAAYLDSVCKDDPEQRKRINGLLAAHDRAGAFLGRPAVAMPDPDVTTTNASRVPGAAAVGGGATHTQGELADEDTGDALGFLEPAGRPDSLGRIAGREVLEVVGRGGFGIVFRAFDEKLQRVDAVKVLAPSMAVTSPARKRFIREAQSAAQIKHENVVRVIEVSRDDERLPYLVMEFISGETLQQRLDRNGPLEVPEVVRVGRQIAEGLAAAHEKGIIHRDIKPSNILIDRGPHEQAKITDFGLARAADDASLTRSGVVAGTPMYMAPEQAKGETLDHRADLFSLGSVMYAMLTGRPPFRAETTLSVLKRVAEDTPRPMREIIPEIPEWLCRIVAKLHAKNPADRFQTAREVADVLADCERQLQVHGALKDRSRIPAGMPAPVRSRGETGRVVAGLVSLVVLALWLGQFTLLYATGQGQICFSGESDPDVERVVVRRGGEPIATLDRANPRVKLAPGDYELEVVCVPGYELAKYHLGTRRFYTTSILFSRTESEGRIRLGVRRGDTVTVTPTAERLAAPPPSPGPAPSDGGWVQLFNGRDLTGWKVAFGVVPGAWQVRDGAIVGSGKLQCLATERATFRDFHLRAEVKINAGGDASIYFRGPGVVADDAMQAHIRNGADANGTGSLSREAVGLSEPVPAPPIPPGEWFLFEIIAQGDRVETRVAGKVLARANDRKQRSGPIGPIGLVSFNKDTVVHFRKIQVKELPATPAPPPPAVAPFDAVKAKAHQDAWAKYLGVPVEYENRIGMKLRLIPPGEFTIGSSPEEVEALRNTPEYRARGWAWSWISGSGPARRTTVAEPFYMGVHEVTVGQFRQFVAAKKYKTAGEKNGGLVWNSKGGWTRAASHVWNDSEFVGSESHPVGFMTLPDAQAFCAWLSERDGLRYVVPTEEYWEFACRAGTTTRWSFGDDPEAMKEHGWTTPHADGKHHPVGRLAANPFGLFDLYGNACELARVARGELVERGGDVRQSALWAQSATRSATITDPNAAFQHGGFRVAIVGDLRPKVPQPAVAPFDAAKAKEYQDAWARHLGVPVETTNSIGMTLRLIPPGEFLMGSAPDDHEKSLGELKKHGKSGWFFEFVEARSGPQRAVRLTRPYYLGAHEVTVGDFRRFVKETGYRTLAEKDAGKPYWEKPAWKAEVDPRHPVTYLAWEDANAFCDWLGRKDGRTYRLPTEAEWEFACRAGTTTRWSWGDDRTQFLHHAWFSRPLPGGLGRVGEKTPNAFGLFDMHGNAEEWCADWHHPMLTVTPTDPHRTEQKDATGRVVRGGFGFDIPELGRSGRRSFAAPGNTTGIAFGFRVAIVGDLKATPPASDKERLQGEWVGESGESLGIPLAADKVKQMRLEFAGANLRVTQPGKPIQEGTFKLDPDADPKEIDAIRNDDQVSRGIYKLDGDRLTVCMGDASPNRPREFRTGPDTGSVLLVTLRRATAADTPAPKQPDPAVLQPLKDAVAAHARTLEAVKARYEAGAVSRIELRGAEAAVAEARVNLAEAEGDAAAVVAGLEDLVRLRREERDLVAERVRVGVEAPTALNPLDARLAEAKARLAKARPAVVPKVTPAPPGPEPAPARDQSRDPPRPWVGRD